MYTIIVLGLFFFSNFSIFFFLKNQKSLGVERTEIRRVSSGFFDWGKKKKFQCIPIFLPSNSKDDNP